MVVWSEYRDIRGINRLMIPCGFGSRRRRIGMGLHKRLIILKGIIHRKRGITVV